jgi:hypothetical protein
VQKWTSFEIEKSKSIVVQCVHYGFNSSKQCIWLIQVQFIEYGLDFVPHLEPSASLLIGVSYPGAGQKTPCLLYIATMSI